MRLQEEAIDLFENQLDIRSIVKTRMDLNILLRSLLSREQLLLFQNQHSRAFATYDSPDEKEVEAETNDEPEVDLLNQNLHFQPKNRSIEAAFKEIKGYQIKIKLDQKLLLDVWLQEKSKRNVRLSPTESFSVEIDDLSQS